MSFAECNYAECCNAECRYFECHCVECHYTECRCPKCRGAVKGKDDDINPPFGHSHFEIFKYSNLGFNTVPFSLSLPLSLSPLT